VYVPRYHHRATRTLLTTAQFIPLNPRPMLQGLVNKEVIIRIKWGQEYTGRLVSVDSYMNIQLSGAKEWKDGVDAGTLGQVLIR
jgi:small nuclear ribonucleoprotein F